MEIKQYTIVLVNLDPTIGSEIRKTRPCVIISPDEMNKYLRTVVIAPMTSNLKNYPSRTAVGHKGKKRMIAMDQIRTIYRVRIVKCFNALSRTEIKNCKLVLKEKPVD